jgi:Platelet-activating factor acetylhydrolase, isoform II
MNIPREIVVDVWYPAAQPQPGAQPTAYFPYADKIDLSPYANAERRDLGNLWPMIVSGRVHSHTYENAPVAFSQARFPLLIFSHAIGSEPYVYAHQIEELVSHGYVVATIHHTYEASVAVFSDGRMIPFSEENFLRSRVEGVEDISNERKWEDERFDVWAGDMRFTLDQITRLTMGPPSKAALAGRVDLAHVGAFGHSFGGIAVARACELDQRFKACLNQDGMGNDGPLQLYEGGHPPTQPFMFLRSPRLGTPSDEKLKAMQLTRKVFERDRVEALAKLDKELQSCSGGAYQVWIETPGFRHDGFGDLHLLRAAGNAGDTAKALKAQGLVVSYTNAFFDKYLNGASDTLLDHGPVKAGDVEIQRYSR